MGHGPTSEDTKDFQFWAESKKFSCREVSHTVKWDSEEIGLHGHSYWEKPISLSRKMGHGPTSEDTKDFQFWAESKKFLAVKCHKQ
ncbi:hypothetical protein CDAR_577811 [Caerostris darwini]|uniref:Uncharacterized protein n=1 Tax=Caerostris darwini TaxID=1538125 RepID=A0AAV4RJQ1_9ARAC|nr:hypothetical protein CDAR_577811 [Caerostris darwini]